MRVIPPLTITNSMLTSSTITEPSVGEPPLWSVSTPYVIGNQVYVAGSTHRIYECTANITGGNSPEIAYSLANTPWLEIAPTNKWAMFDLFRNTQTTSDSDMLIVLTPGISVDSIAVLGLSNVSSVNVTCLSSGLEVYNKVLSLSARSPKGWWDYFFSPLARNTAALAFDLPSQYSNLVIYVTIYGNDTRGVGALVIGTSSYIGSVQRGATTEILNFSTIDRDEFGNAVLVPRRSIPKTNQKLYIDKSLIFPVHQIRDSLDAIPAVWSGLDDDYGNPYFNALVILGFYRTFSFEIDNPIGPMINLELEEI